MGQNLGKSLPSDSYWVKTRVKDIVGGSGGSVITVGLEDTIEASLAKLHNNKILSAPIVGSDGKCLGFWGMDNLIIALLKATSSPITLKGRPRSNSLKTDSAQEHEHRLKKFHSKQLTDCVFERNFHGVALNSSLQDAMLAFAHGVQRVAVFDNLEKKGSVKYILSQSKILSYIDADTSRLGTLENTPASALGIPWDRVIKAKSDTKTIDVLQQMHDRGVWGIPIIDENDNLISHLSFTDFKILHKEKHFSNLVDPVIDFIKHAREQQKTRHWDYIVHAKSDALLKDVVHLLVQEHVHQLYLFDSDNKPSAIISMTNICHKIFHHKDLPKP